MWKEKLGNYFIDVSKYVLTGVVITSFFKDFGESKMTIYGIGTAFAIIILIVGLILTNKKNNNLIFSIRDTDIIYCFMGNSCQTKINRHIYSI